MPEVTRTIGLKDGEKVFIRTVTNYFTGRVVATDEKFVALDDCAWIGSTGRFATAMATGVLDEIEPYPDGDTVLVSLGAIIDIAPWNHDLPRTQK